ncbi:MAG: hypothetical protein RJA98_124 [Pseudomonadota bacterium]|jgi:hypothetical protein
MRQSAHLGGHARAITLLCVTPEIGLGTGHGARSWPPQSASGSAQRRLKPGTVCRHMGPVAAVDLKVSGLGEVAVANHFCGLLR